MVSLPVSVSMLHGNIVASDKTLAFASNIKPNPQIHLVSIESLQAPNIATQLVKYKNEEEVLHINYVNINSSWYLVLGFYQHLHIWNEDGSRMLGFISKDDITNGDNLTYFIGSCGYSLQNSILIGCSKVCISVLTTSKDRNNAFHISKTIYTKSNEPIAVVCCHKNTALSCGELGTVLFWDIQIGCVICTIDGNGITGTVGTSIKKYSVICYGNGEIKIFNMKEKRLQCSLWSHSRWITGISQHLSRPIFVTCSEDGFANAWGLRRGEIELVGSKEYPNCLLTGVAVIKEQIHLVAYDKTRLIIDYIF